MRVSLRIGDLLDAGETAYVIRVSMGQDDVAYISRLFAGLADALNDLFLTSGPARVDQGPALGRLKQECVDGHYQYRVQALNRFVSSSFSSAAIDRISNGSTESYRSRPLLCPQSLLEVRHTRALRLTVGQARASISGKS